MQAFSLTVLLLAVVIAENEDLSIIPNSRKGRGGLSGGKTVVVIPASSGGEAVRIIHKETFKLY